MDLRRFLSQCHASFPFEASKAAYEPHNCQQPVRHPIRTSMPLEVGMPTADRLGSELLNFSVVEMMLSDASCQGKPLRWDHGKVSFHIWKMVMKAQVKR